MLTSSTNKLHTKLLEAMNIEGPPRIPELDTKGYRATMAVRDFPIDWTVLMENISHRNEWVFVYNRTVL